MNVEQSEIVLTIQCMSVCVLTIFFVVTRFVFFYFASKQWLCQIVTLCKCVYCARFITKPYSCKFQVEWKTAFCLLFFLRFLQHFRRFFAFYFTLELCFGQNYKCHCCFVLPKKQTKNSFFIIIKRSTKSLHKQQRKIIILYAANTKLRYKINDHDFHTNFSYI